MLPGRTYTPVDFLLMAWKRRWLLVVPTVVISSAVFLWAKSLPNIYRSETSVLIVPQRVPQDYVKPTVTTQIEDRLQMISQQILSRSRLERIVQEFNLYEKERKTMIMEDVIERMRARDIHVEIVTNRRSSSNDATAFKVSYESAQARTAQQVAERLATLFVQENLEDRALLADATNQFLQAQLDDARRRLIEHEHKLEDFREKNSGRLPSQVQANLQMMQSSQSQLQALQESTNRDRDRLAVIDGVLSEADAAPPAPVTSADPAANAGTPAQQLEAAKAALAALQLRLKPEHPDIGRAKRMIAELESKVTADGNADSLTPLAPAVRPSPADSRYAAMRIEAAEIRRRLATRKQEEERLQRVMGSYTGRLDAAPALESELTELMRDYSTLQESYTSLLKKAEESKIAVNLERRQIGEQFRILDSARLPERPISPDRARLDMMGLLAGLGLGIGLVAFLEFRDTTLKTDDDVFISLSLPVLAVVPAMVSVHERTKRRRLHMAIAVSASTIFVVAFLAVWRLHLIENWIR